MQGTAVYVPEKDAMMWKIKNFPGGREFLMRCRFALPSVAAEEVPAGRMPPIRVNFEIPYLTVSGIQVGHRDGKGSAGGSEELCDRTAGSGLPNGTMAGCMCLRLAAADRAAFAARLGGSVPEHHAACR